jgi:uncharacterized membrane protein
MPSDTPRATARLGGHPIHAMLTPVPIICFVGTLCSDIAYWATANMMWADLSAWLLTIGLVISILVVLAGLVDFLGDRRIRKLGVSWVHAIGNGLALVLAIFNAFVHTRDAWTSVVPTGLILSALVVLILLVTTWLGRELVFRHGVGVRLEDRR